MSTSSLFVRLLLLSLLTACIPVPAAAQIPAGTLIWLRADSGVVNGNGRVMLWQDKSGRGHDAGQDTLAQRPALAAKVANGHHAVHFDGASYMETAPVFPVRADYSLTVVVRVNDAAAVNNIVSGISHAHWLGSNLYPKVLHGGNFSTQSVAKIQLAPGFNVITMTYAEARQRAAIYVDGYFADSAVTGPNVDSTIFLGAFQRGNYLKGDIAEVLLYGRELAGNERRKLDSSLLLKYGIAVPQPAAPPAAGPLLWLKADSGIGVTGGRVAQWHDRSGNGYAALQDVDTLRPTLVANATFNLPAVRFDGSGPFMEASSVFPVNSDYTLLFVVRLNNLAATNNIVSGNSHAHWFGGNAYAKVLHGNFAAQATSPIPAAAAEFTIVTMSYLQARQRAAIYLNGIFADSNVVGANTDSTIFLGAFARANVMNGDLAEVLLYDRELSRTDRETSERYLFRKYGIAVPPPPVIDTTFTAIPKSLQLSPRDDDDSATVPIAGVMRRAGFDSIYVLIWRGGALWKRLAAPLHYSGGGAPFSLAPKIHAGFSEYSFTIGGWSGSGGTTVLAVRDSIVCGDVFLITGQSNSIFGGVPDSYEFCRTFGNNYSSSPRDTLWALARADGNGGGPHVGAWGLRLGKLLMERSRVPICIINGGVGGTTIEQHQRNDAMPADLSTIYGSMLYRVRKAGLQAKAKAILWYQGESNTITNYYANFKALYQDWRNDFPGARKFYVVQIRPGCAAGPHSELRELQRTLPDSFPVIEAFSVMGVPGHDGCHFAASGYDTIGVQLERLVARDFYGSTDTIDIDAPNIRRAFFTDSTHARITLLFDHATTGLYTTPDTIVDAVSAGIHDAFALDDSAGLVASVRIARDTVVLTLAAPFAAKNVSYIPSQNYPGTTVIYEGPWLKNMRGVGAFSFHHIPIGQPPASGVPAEPDATMDAIAVPNPFTQRTELRVTLARSGPLEIVLRDLLGAEARRIRVTGHAGENHIAIEREGLAAGIYFCTVGGRVVRLVVQ